MLKIVIINNIIATMNYDSYLEIGCDYNDNFCAVNSRHKVGIDPVRGGTLQITSDDFFKINREYFDMVFVDGLHHREQVLRDIRNSLRWLRPGGTILVHDCLPKQKKHQLRNRISPASPWTGDVWKAIVDLRALHHCDVAVLDEEWGMGIVKARQNSLILDPIPVKLTWSMFVKHRNELLRVMDYNQAMHFIS